MSGVPPDTQMHLTLTSRDVNAVLQVLAAQRVDSGFAPLWQEILRQAEAQTTPPPTAAP